jgi:hypothetical protein
LSATRKELQVATREQTGARWLPCADMRWRTPRIASEGITGALRRRSAQGPLTTPYGAGIGSSH